MTYAEIAISLGLGLLCTAIAFCVIWLIIAKIVHVRKFTQIFSVSLASEDLKAFQKRDVVTPKLQELADLLDEEYEKNQSFHNAISEGKAIWSQGFEENIKAIEQKIKLARRAFWQAHNVAQYLGFDLSTSYKKFVTRRKVL